MFDRILNSSRKERFTKCDIEPDKTSVWSFDIYVGKLLQPYNLMLKFSTILIYFQGWLDETIKTLCFLSKYFLGDFFSLEILF